MVQLFKIKELTWDPDIYPRNVVYWMTALSYKSAMESGAKFPPITVAKKDHRFYVIDGWHRIEACKKLKRNSIEGEIVNLPKNKWRAEAITLSIKLNSAHGKVFSVQERAKAILSLKKLGFTQEKISKIVHIPISSFETFVGKRMVTNFQGEKYIVKAPMKHMQGKKFTLPIPDDTMAAQSQSILLQNVIEILENKIIDTKNPAVMKRAEKVYTLLSEII